MFNWRLNVIYINATCPHFIGAFANIQLNGKDKYLPRPLAKSSEYSRDIKILQNGVLTRPIVTFSSRLPQRRNGGVTCSVAVYRAAPPAYGACADDIDSAV